MPEAIRVEGLRELERALRGSDRDSLKALRKELREAGKMVALDARARFTGVHAYSAMGMRPRTRSGLTVSVEQSRPRTTGKHPEFGSLQMRRAFVPALEDNRERVEERVEEAIDRVGRSHGF